MSNFQRLLEAPLLLSKAFLGLRLGKSKTARVTPLVSRPDPSPESQSHLGKTHSQLEAGLEGLMRASLSHTSLMGPRWCPRDRLRVLLWLCDLSVSPNGPSRAAVLLLLGSPSPSCFPVTLAGGVGCQAV